MKQAKRNNTLTEGPIFKTLVMLALPIMASTCFMSAYNITDMMWIGRLGSGSVAAVGAAGMFLWFSQGLAALAKMGGQVLTAQSLGRKDEEAAGHYAAGALKLAAVFGLLVAALCELLAPGLIGLFGLSDPGTNQAAALYLRITGGAVIFSYLNQVLTGLFMAHGDSGIPLLSNTLGLIANMLLDAALVLGKFGFPRLEVAGAALATVTAQVISTLVFLAALCLRSGRIRILPYLPLKAAPGVYRGILRIGLPAGLQTCMYSLISMVLTRLVAGFGDGAVAVQRVGAQIESLTWNAADGFGAAINAFAAQNYGACRPDRIRKGYGISALTAGVWGLLFTVLFLVFPGQISGLFFFEPDVKALSVGYLMIVGLSEAFMAVEIVAGQAISGMGKTRVSSLISIILTGLRIPLALALGLTSLKLDGIWWTLTLTSMLKGLALHLAFFAVLKRFALFASQDGSYSSQPSRKR